MSCNLWLFVVRAWATNFLHRLIVSLGLGFALLISFLALSAHAQNSPEVQRGLTWLQAQVQSDGALSGEVTSSATPVQTRSEAALAFVELTGGAAVSEPLRAKLVLEAGEATEYLARKIIALKGIASDTTALISQLSHRQNVDGGFGSISGDSSTLLDTVWAYSALSGDPSFTGENTARSFILTKMESDGGLAGDSAGQRIQNSALGIRALQFSGADLSVMNATRQLVQWLQAQQQANGSWNSSSYLTAIALHALSSQGADSVACANARSYLMARQAADGSWDADPFLTAVILRALVITPTTAPTPQASSIAGIFVNPLSGTPIAGVQVSMTGTASSVATSGSDGRFAITGLSSGSYTLQLAKAGFASASRSATLGYGQSLDLGSIGMEQLASAGLVKGRVSDAVSTLAITGASVTLSGPVTMTALTDSQGNYEFANVPAGAVSITVSKTGFSPVTAAGSIEVGRTLLFSPTLYEQNAPGVPTTASLVGKVISAGTNVALPGVAIELNGVNLGVSGADGRFEIKLAPQSYAMRIAPIGYDAVAASFLVSAGAVADMGTIALSPKRTTTELGGRITDKVSGKAVSGAQISLVGGTSVVSGPDGSYTLPNLVGSIFDIRVAATGYLSQVLQLQVERPSAIAQDFAIVPEPVSAIDLSSLVVSPASVAAHASVGMSAIVTNSGTTAQDIVLMLQVLNQEGKVVATGSAFTSDGVNLLGSFSLGAAQQRAVTFKWNSAQFPPGSYRLTGSVVQAGTVSRENPTGKVLATRSESLTITPSIQLVGSVASDPPVLQANTGATVKLSALLQNNGNIELGAQTYRLQVVDEKTSAVVNSSDVSSTALQSNQIDTLNFANWVPTSGGNFRLEVTVPGAPELGKLTGKLYVGDAATASYTVNKTLVSPGNQTVRATLLVTGQDLATGTISDPLEGPIKAAIQKGVTYNDLQASNWVLSNKCLGCHVVTQALVGGELTRRLTTFDNTQRNSLFNALSTNRQPSGALYASHPEYQKTQTTLGLWALNSWRAKDDFAASLSAVADFILGQQDSAGGWSADHPTGGWDAPPANTAFNLKSLTEVVETLQRVPNPIGYSSQVWKSGDGLNGTYYLEKTLTGQVLVSNYFAGTVTAINSDGTTQTLVSGLSYPQGLLQAADGSLYIVTASDIRKRSADGTVSVFAALPQATGITLGADGYLYVSQSNTSTIYRVSGSGEVTTYMRGDPLSGPIGLTFDTSGNLIVGNYSGKNIVRIKPDKSYEVLVTWTNGNPRSIVPEGNGWLIGTTTGTYRYNANWQGDRLSFSASEGIAILPDKTIVTSDGGSSVSKLAPVAIDGAAKIASYSNAIGKASTWLLNDANINASSNLELAHQLIGLGSAKRFYANNPLASTLQAKMVQVGEQLRARQASDGGWGRWQGWGSDSLVTAQVGYALDYLQPTAADPVVQKAIKFLLARQQADGSWVSENVVLTTKLAATTWVEIWLPIALDRIGGIDADVTLRFAPDVSVSNASLAPTSTVNNPDGSTALNWKLTGVTSASRNIQFDLGLQNMQLGEKRPASAEAYMTFGNSFTGETVNSPIQIPTISASAFLALQVSSDHAEYGANSPVVIAGQVTNSGETAAGGTVEFSIYGADGASVASIGRVPFNDIAAGASGSVPALWNTQTVYAGQYFVEAKLYDAANRYVATARSALTIAAAGSAGGSTLTGFIKTDKQTYAPTEVIRLSDLITNLALNQNESGLKAQTSIVNPDGSVRWTVTAPLLELAAGALRDVGYSVPLNTAAPGSYTVRLVVTNAGGTVVATDSRLFTVQSSAVSGAGLVGSIQATPKEVAQGETVTLNFDAINRGNAALESLALTVNVVDPVAQQVVATFPYVISVSQGATYASNAKWTATGATGKTYVAVLSAVVGTTTLTLGQDSFTVKNMPRPKLGIDQALSNPGRVLVLVSCKNHDAGDTAIDADERACSKPAEEQDEDQDKSGTCVADRAHTIDQALTALGVSHMVVTSTTEFKRAFRSGLYNTYWISGKQYKLHDELASELREAVFGGDRLILDGVHDERNKVLDEVAGISYRGKLGQQGLPVNTTGALFAAQSLPSVGRALKLLPGGAQSVAAFSGTGPNATGPAILTHDYGQGRSILFSFDLVSSLRAQALWQPVLQSALQYLLPAQPGTLTPGALLPVKTTVASQGPATGVQVNMTLPAAAAAIGSSPTATLDAAANTAGWAFDLAAGQTRELFLTLRVPPASGSYALQTRVSTVSNGAATPYGAPLPLSFTVAAAAQSHTDARAALLALPLASKKDQQARDKLLQDLSAAMAAFDLHSAKGYEDAIAKLAGVVDCLGKLSTADTTAVRLGLDRILKEAQWRWSLLPAS